MQKQFGNLHGSIRLLFRYSSYAESCQIEVAFQLWPDAMELRLLMTLHGSTFAKGLAIGAVYC